MRVNRTFLYWGVFLAALGGVLVIADLNGVDESTWGDALRLWPFALVAIGLGLALRRSRFNVASGMLAAAVPGLLVGGAIAVGPHFAIDCGAHGEPATFDTSEGSFDGAAEVSVASGCGTLVVGTAAGSAWRLDAGNADDLVANVESSPTSLRIDSGRGSGWRGFDRGRDVWRLTLPTSPIDDLTLVVNAGEGQIDLANAQLGHLDLTTNAGRTAIDLASTSVTTLDGTLNAGQLTVTLPATSDLHGSVEVNAGELQVCIPSGVGLRVQNTTVLGAITYNGTNQDGSEWQSPDYASAAHRTDLTVSVNLGSVDINPIGGCK